MGFCIFYPVGCILGSVRVSRGLLLLSSGSYLLGTVLVNGIPYFN